MPMSSSCSRRSPGGCDHAHERARPPRLLFVICPRDAEALRFCLMVEEVLDDHEPEEEAKEMDDMKNGTTHQGGKDVCEKVVA